MVQIKNALAGADDPRTNNTTGQQRVTMSAAERFKVNFRDQIAKKKITLADLARAVEMSRPNLSRLANGRNSGLTVGTAERIAEVLNCDIIDLLALPRAPAPPQMVTKESP